MNPILILGGYGGAGRRIARLLLAHTHARVGIAGRRIEAAEAFVDELRKEFPEERVFPVFADADQPESLKAAFSRMQIVIVAASVPNKVHELAEAAFEAGCDYLDLFYRQDTWPVMNALREKAHERNQLFITQAGFHPGLPAAYIRHVSQWFDRCLSVNVAMAMRGVFENSDSAQELIWEFGNYQGIIYKEGAWQEVKTKDFPLVDLGPAFGKKRCYPIQLTEVLDLPERLELKEIGVFVAGFNWFTDYVVTPLILLSQKIRRGFGMKAMSRLLVWSANTFSRGEKAVAFRLDARGFYKGQPASAYMLSTHSDAYLFTAIPVVALIKQYLLGQLPTSGVYLMGQVVNTPDLFRDLEAMGVHTEFNPPELAPTDKLLAEAS